MNKFRRVIASSIETVNGQAAPATITSLANKVKAGKVIVNCDLYDGSGAKYIWTLATLDAKDQDFKQKPYSDCTVVSDAVATLGASIATAVGSRPYVLAALYYDVAAAKMIATILFL